MVPSIAYCISLREEEKRTDHRFNKQRFTHCSLPLGRRHTRLCLPMKYTSGTVIVLFCCQSTPTYSFAHSHSPSNCYILSPFSFLLAFHNCVAPNIRPTMLSYKSFLLCFFLCCVTVCPHLFVQQSPFFRAPHSPIALAISLLQVVSTQWSLPR